jgi:Putative MetA-pathway of phenol degradation
VASFPLFAGVASAACALTFSSAVAGARCASDTIATDRPDVTNSSVVVPAGTFQSENGLDLVKLRTATVLEGTESRLRLGVATCLELLVDLPSYSLGVAGDAPPGFSNLAPAIKWQPGPLPGEVDLSVTVGAALPAGRARLVGRGPQPYLQLPWSRELGDGWGVSGMLTAFFSPANSAGSAATQSTLAIERELGDRTDVFIEYAGDFRSHDRPSHLLNVGGAFRFTPRQQLDFHVAGGLTRSAPSYVVGVGYSIRFDGLF